MKSFVISEIILISPNILLPALKTKILHVSCKSSNKKKKINNTEKLFGVLICK